MPSDVIVCVSRMYSREYIAELNILSVAPKRHACD